MLARRHGAALLPAGSTTLGLDAAKREALLAALADHERTRPRRSSIRWAEPLIEVTADVHGRADGPVRDAVMREVFLSG